ncbi:MAG: HAD-IA family hydrolase [Dissulfurispiraceae bacterium]|nr:HAD-IA family hydrolase [Dissulfurispiraceae bacterium]
MIRTVIFDFDGVILESAAVKTKAFRMLFEDDYPNKVEEITGYHLQNMGVSRYLKFQYIHETILNLPLSTEKERELGERFSALVLDEILKASFVAGALEFLENNSDKYDMFIASGTPENELHHILKQRDIAHFFAEAHGSPKHKHMIIFDIMHQYNLNQQEVVFVGDADSDRRAAEQTGIAFIARLTEENRNSLKECKWKVDDLTELPSAIKKVEDCLQ